MRIPIFVLLVFIICMTATPEAMAVGEAPSPYVQAEVKAMVEAVHAYVREHSDDMAAVPHALQTDPEFLDHYWNLYIFIHRYDIELEEALRENQQLLANILESTNEGIVVLETEFRHKIFNRAAEKMFNIQKRQALGKTPWELFPSMKRPDIPEHIESAMKGRVIGSIENHVLLPWPG